MVLPVFYFKSMVMIMAQPSEYIKHKMAIKEQMNQDLNEEEKKFIKQNAQEILKIKARERKEEKLKKFEEEKSLHLMYKKKVAKGPNPLSVKRGREGEEKQQNEDSQKKKRKRAGARKKREDKAESKE
jgi:hypothetical protein